MKFKQGTFYKSLSNSIFNNLAFEGHIYKSKTLAAPSLVLYRNSPSIIIGRNQNAWKECKLERIRENNVALCRRNSGGGAVYQDLGRLIRQSLLRVYISDH
jgi:lipoate-protein ligase A